jgi:hypothetical protein
MNYGPQGRGTIRGACWGTAGRGHDAGSPAPFVMSDGGMRRARPAEPPDLRPLWLSKLFLSLTGLAADVFI